MKHTMLLLLLFMIATFTYARHMKGGSITYTYLGPGATAYTSKYRITVKHYIDCTNIQFEEPQVYLGIFEGLNNNLERTITINRQNLVELQKTTFNSCINPVPDICFYLATYEETVDLADNTGGYTLSEQECCRIAGIQNVNNSSNYGITNTNTIPGIVNNVIMRKNSSPVFVEKDTSVICYNSFFTLDFSANDVDSDSLAYAFCPGKTGGSNMDRQPNPPLAGPYQDISYSPGYSALSPLGSKVSINPKTGMISGIAPGETGTYVVSVCANEYRGGVLIGSTKKEVHVTVADCSLTAATLKPVYINCDNFSFHFENESTASNINSYSWNFGVAGTAADTSSQPTPDYTYADTGTYVLKLRVSSSAGCADSTSSTVKVYPGFSTAFHVSGSCFQSPFFFADSSYAKYGFINSWSWNFGDPSSAADTSNQQNPSHQYSAPGNATVTLNITSSKGCVGTLSKPVIVNDKPDFYLPFTDTLICSKDNLPLLVQSNTATIFSWSPAYNMINPNSKNPVVFPKDTTVYTVVVRDKGCIDSATVKVNVLDLITVSLSDTAMCKTDSITLKPVSDALGYSWRESTGLTSLNNYQIKYPEASPAVTTTYYVNAHLGYCQDSTKATVYVSSYPSVAAGNDTAICYGNTAQLHGITNAAYFGWLPASSLLNAQTLNPVAGPPETTDYLLTVRDTFYCPKPVTDTVTVTVITPVVVHAGNDTSVVVGQPLQLQATANHANVNFNWLPLTGMYDNTVYNPVVIINSTNIDSIIFSATATTPEGCKGSDNLTVKIFKTAPEIFVPTAFTPNADGLNDILKPVLVGIKQLEFFRVFNRWGQPVFATTEIGKGWDGTINGTLQSSGTYVYEARGTDYAGKIIFRKGTVVLIR